MFEMKRIARTLMTFAAAVLLAFMAGGCSKVKDIKVTSCGLESYSLKGFRAVDAVLSVGIDNPAMAFTVTGLNGILKYNGEDIASYTADTLKVERKCSKVYDLPCSAVLSERMSLKQIMNIATNRSLEGLTTDIEVKVHLKGASKTLKLKDLDIAKMID